MGGGGLRGGVEGVKMGGRVGRGEKGRRLEAQGRKNRERGGKGWGWKGKGWGVGG